MPATAAQLIKNELEKLDAKIPNEPETLEGYKKCVLFLGALASACAGILIGVAATILVTLGLLIIDYFVPDADDSPGAVVK